MGDAFLLDPASLDAGQPRAFEAMEAQAVPWASASGFRAQNDAGRMIGPFNGVLYSPEIATAFLAWQTTEGEHTTVDARTRQVVILSHLTCPSAANEYSP